MRTLINTIELTPVCQDGTETLSITLHGDLAGILGLAAKAKGPLDESDPVVPCTKLVAGARNHLYRTLMMWLRARGLAYHERPGVRAASHTSPGLAADARLQ
jgi:hypothetical protein